MKQNILSFFIFIIVGNFASAKDDRQSARFSDEEDKIQVSYSKAKVTRSAKTVRQHTIKDMFGEINSKKRKREDGEGSSSS